MGDQDKILSQSEIDALLSAIESGDVQVGAETAPSRHVTVYDFKRPERVARDQLRALESLHEVFARNLQTTLSGMLRSVVDISISSVDQLTFSEFINSLPNPTLFHVVSFEPHEGNCILELNPTIAFPIIERMLGSGRVSSAVPDREFTPIEWNLIERVVERALEMLKQVWSPILQFEPKVTSRGSNPQLMQIMSPNEPVVMIGIELSMGEHKGYLNLCIPVMMFEPVMEKISTRTWFSTRRREGAQGQEAVISKTLSEAEVVLLAHLQVDSIELSQLRALRAGDVVRLSHGKDRPVTVSVEGQPKFRARLGRYRDHRAVCIQDPILNDDEYRPRQPTGRVGIDTGAPKEDEQGTPARGESAGVEGILQIPVTTAVVLTEKMLPLRDVLTLKTGDIIEFEKSVEEPLSLRAESREIARGLAVKIGERFGLQVTRIGSPGETVRTLGSTP